MSYQPKGELQIAVLKHLADNGPAFEDDLVRALGGDALAVRGAIACCRQGRAVARTVETVRPPCQRTAWRYALVEQKPVSFERVSGVPARKAPPVYLLEAYSKGRHAAQVGFNTFNPYRDDEQMAAAWLKGWESAGRD